MDRNNDLIKKHSENLIFNQRDINVFCDIMNLKNTAHDDIKEAKLLGYSKTIVPAIFAMSTSLSVLNDFIFPDYEPLELYREYTCVRPIFVGDVYKMDYILKQFDYENFIGTVTLRLKNDKGQICLNGFVQLKLINLKEEKYIFIV